ncbi:MAG: hypothetical protein Q8R49_01895 [Rhodoferax sp.]|nr:hypothetical protein [Rhodoferax sp.]
MAINTIDHMDEINKTGGMASILTHEFMPYRVPNLHPGAARAYREAKLIS